MRTRAALSASITVMVAVVLCATILTGIVEARIGEAMEDQAKAAAADMTVCIGDVTEHTGWRSARECVVSLMNDPNIAFVAFEKHDGELIAAEIKNERMWRVYQKSQSVGADHDAESAESGSLRAARRLVGVYAIRSAQQARGADHSGARIVIGFADPGYMTLLSRLRQVGALTALAVAAAVMPLATLVASGIIRPLSRMSRAAEQFARGEVPDTLSESGPAEIVSLSRSFNAMINQLSEAQLALMRVNKGLEETVQERTNELQRVNRILESQIRDKNEFLRIVSHDLGAPLRNIAGMTSLLIETHGEELPHEALHRLERIAANVEIETDMLNDLLELSRTMSTPARSSDVKSERVAREAAYVFEHELRNKSILLKIDEGMAPAHVDPSRLRTVFQNLIDNAIKYMGDSPVRKITVGSERRDGRVLFSVSDSGPGVPEEDRDRIFQLFRRGSASSRVEGKGVGLAAVRAIVESWGGRIDVQKSPEGGCRFVFTAPAALGESGDVAQVRESAPGR